MQLQKKLKNKVDELRMHEMCGGKCSWDNDTVTKVAKRSLALNTISDTYILGLAD